MARLDLSGVDLTKLTDEEIDAIENGTFFKKLKEVDTSRDYSIIVDMSGSMGCTDSTTGGKTRWKAAEEAIELLVPAAIKCDPDGITLYFFDSSFEKFENVKSLEDVRTKFKSRGPRGSTALHKVLADAVLEDGAPPVTVFGGGGGGGAVDHPVPSKPRKPETILIITDGSPDSKKDVEDVIINATKLMQSDNDLSITFVQVGNDSGVDSWMQTLDDGLKAKGAKFDIVDVIGISQTKGMSFADIIAKSIAD